MMALSRPFKGRSSSASSFHASLLQAIDGVVSLALCPQVVFQAPQQFRSFEKRATCEGCFSPPVCLLGHFPSLRHVQGSVPTGVFEGGCRPSTHSSLGFPFHFSLFVAQVAHKLMIYRNRPIDITSKTVAHKKKTSNISKHAH